MGDCNYTARILQSMSETKRIRWGLMPLHLRSYGGDLLREVRQREEQETLTTSFQEDVEETG